MSSGLSCDQLAIVANHRDNPMPNTMGTLKVTIAVEEISLLS